MHKVGSLLVASAVWAATGSIGYAADLPVKAPAAPLPAAYNWTGLYVGGHIGGAWIDETASFAGTSLIATSTIGREYQLNHQGFLGGVQLGYNYQIQNWVLGVQGDFSWTDANTSTTSIGNVVAATEVLTSKTKSIATVTGRFGYALNNWLFFVKGGGAWADMEYGGSASFPPVTTVYENTSKTRSGWTVGGGIEWGIWDKWSAQLEYDYLDFGTDRITANAIGGGVVSFDAKTNVSVAKLALNYRF